jgi:hypothetical protein
MSSSNASVSAAFVVRLSSTACDDSDKHAHCDKLGKTQGNTPYTVDL